MVRLKFFIELKYEIAGYPSDFIFNIHAARTPAQSIVVENLQAEPAVPVSLFIDPAHGTRYPRLRAGPGHLMVRYDATVDIEHHPAPPASLPALPIAYLPAK